MIKIKTQKIVINGEKYRKILHVAILRREKLPKRYVDSGEAVFLLNKGQVGRHYCVGSKNVGLDPDFLWFGEDNISYKEEDFAEKLEVLRRCGERLKRINEELAKENEGWEGEETFII